MWLCVNVTAGRVGRMYGNYANVQENFRVFLPLKVAQCLKGAWKLLVRSLPVNPVPEHCCGSLMAPVQSVAFSGPCRSATATARARGCKIPKAQETQSALQHRGLPVGNKAAPCFSAPSCPGLSLYVFPSLSLGHWHIDTMPISHSWVVAATFPLLYKMFAWSQQIHELILLYFYPCKKTHEGTSVWSRFDVPQGQGAPPQLLKAVGFVLQKVLHVLHLWFVIVRL